MELCSALAAGCCACELAFNLLNGRACRGAHEAGFFGKGSAFFAVGRILAIHLAGCSRLARARPLAGDELLDKRRSARRYLVVRLRKREALGGMRRVGAVGNARVFAVALPGALFREEELGHVYLRAAHEAYFLRVCETCVAVCRLVAIYAARVARVAVVELGYRVRDFGDCRSAGRGRGGVGLRKRRRCAAHEKHSGGSRVKEFLHITQKDWS